MARATEKPKILRAHANSNTLRTKAAHTVR